MAAASCRKERESRRTVAMQDVPGFGAVRTQTPAPASRAGAAPGGSRKGRPGPGSDRIGEEDRLCIRKVASCTASQSGRRSLAPQRPQAYWRAELLHAPRIRCAMRAAAPTACLRAPREPKHPTLVGAAREEPRKQGRDKAGAAARDGGGGFRPGSSGWKSYVGSGASRLRQTTLKGRFGGSPAWRRSTWPSVIQMSRPRKTSDVG